MFNNVSISFSPSSQNASSLSSPTSSPGIFNDSKKFATSRWNLILSIFYQQMPLKCHWFFLWPYENSFTGKEAVEFLLLTLPKISFGKTIQRVNCSMLLQKFLNNSLIINARNPKDLQFSEKVGMIFRFNDAKIEYEISKTNESSFNDSTISFSPNPLLRRALSNNEQNFSCSDNRIPIQHRSATLFSTPPSQSFAFNRTSKRTTFFSSFRKSKNTNPIFNIPPPPSTPPPPFQDYSNRKRDLTRISPPINKKYPRLSNI